MNQETANDPCLLIGVDGGATEAKAHLVHCDNPRNPTSFELGQAAASRKYERLADFEPLPIADQLAQRDAGSIQLTPKEQIQGTMWVQTACEAVLDVARAAGGRQVLVGMGMPGLKTTDRRGICAVNNGPRIPDYLDQFEQRVAELGVELVAPVAALGSDADYCGVGELYAANGLFREVDNAYYVGCGTGIADAMKLRGRLVTFDEARPWLQKAWQIPSAEGPTFEKLVSAKSVNDCYARFLGGDALGEPRYPEADAAEGHPLAVSWMDSVARILAELIFERLDTIANGRCDLAHRGKAYDQLDAAHDFRGTFLDRVVIGQRLGQVFAHRRYRPVFGDKLITYLAAAIAESGDTEMMRHYLRGVRLRPGFCRASKLRAAPALGAAIAATQTMQGTVS